MTGAIKNGQSQGLSQQLAQDQKKKTNKIHNTDKTKTMSNTHPTTNTGDKLICSRRV